LEVYSSIVWGSITRCREAQCHVSYPSEVDDENFSDTGYNPQNSFMTPQQTITNPNCWLHGWNFTTELYRILEHAMDELHLRRLSNIGSVSLSDLFRKRVPHKSVVLDKVTSMYEELPAQFKGIKSMPQNGKGGPDDKIGFQVTNITATFHLLRMILFTSEEATIDQKCAITRDLLDSFAKIPIVFLRASSSPLFHQSAAIGSILGSEMEEPLSESSHLQVREVL
jgi:hypothetical protein